MITCPISVEWETKITGEKITISNVKKYPTTNEKDMISFQGLATTLNVWDYELQLMNAAQKIVSFYSQSKPRKIGDSGETQRFKDFWNDFTRLMTID